MHRAPSSQPTEYSGRVYRSATEARWAFFFDLIRLPAEYEPDGFQLTGMERYLPDFYIPCIRERGISSMWVEVKGREPTPTEKLKLMRVCEAFNCEGLLLVGAPRPNNLMLYYSPQNRADTVDGWRVTSQRLLYDLLGANEGTFKAIWLTSANSFFKAALFSPPRRGKRFVNINDVYELRSSAEALTECKRKLVDTQIWLAAAIFVCAVLILMLLFW